MRIQLNAYICICGYEVISECNGGVEAATNTSIAQGRQQTRLSPG